MSKSYVFKMDKYYNDDEILAVSPIIENFVNIFGDDNGVATLNLKDDVKVVVKRDEGAVLHMVLDNPDHFTGLPKSLTKAKDFLNVFITSMAKEIDKNKKTVDIPDAMAKVGKKAEDSLLGYISDSSDDDKSGDEDDNKSAAVETMNDVFKKIVSDWLKEYLK